MHNRQCTTDKAHKTTLKAPHERVVLRWAKNKEIMYMVLYVHIQKKASLPSARRQTIDYSKLILHAESNVTPMWELLLDRLENIVGKGENAGWQHFLFSDNVFKSHLPLSIKLVFFCQGSCPTTVYTKNYLSLRNQLPPWQEKKNQLLLSKPIHCHMWWRDVLLTWQNFSY